MGRVSLAQKIIFGVVLVVMVGVMGFFLILRDYNVEFVGGTPTLVAKIPIPMASGLSIDNSEEKKLTLKCNKASDVNGYEFRISTHQNMFFGKTYRSEIPKKTIGKLKPGKQYYVQVRCYKANPQGRNVSGQWGMISTSKVKEDPAEMQKRLQKQAQ